MQAIGMNSLALCIVFVALIASAVGQAVHGYLRVIHCGPRTRVSTTLYESALLVHMTLMAAFSLGAASGWPDGSAHFGYLAIPLQPALWVNVAAAVIAGYAALASTEEEEMYPGEDPGWMPAADAIIMLLCTPALMSAVGDAWAYVLCFDAAYFLFRTMYLMVLNRRIRRKVVSPLSIAEAMKRMPEGLLYADAHGRTLVANDAMRHCLSALGLSTDFGKVSDLWKRLNERAESGWAAHVAESVEREPGDWVILRIGPDEVRLFSFEGEGFGTGRRYPSARPLENDSLIQSESRRLLGAEARMRVIAYDVTRETDILQEIDRTNAELADSQRELKESMLTVQEAAENEAMLRMRGRVHDVIGQRLSMLHRALEDEDVSDEKLEQLKPLLTGILDDLAASTHIEPADELDATVNAFALTGVTVRVEGKLPDDEAVAKLFVDCIREGATNAVKHAHSTLVTATCTPAGLVIENDGNPPAGPVVEGTGLSNMRRAVEAAGGTLTIEDDPFKLRVSL